MYVDIFTRSELIKKQDQILNLFHVCFGKSISAESWRWHYIDNPVGPATVSLYYEEDKLLGHYAVVPTLFVKDGISFVAYRSMTTMVHPDGRGKGIFLKLANHMYSILKREGASLVYGFPNQNVTNARRKHLHWKMPISDLVFDIKGIDLINNPDIFEAVVRTSDICWDLGNFKQMQWRLSAPNTKFHYTDHLITKDYQGVQNVLHIDIASYKIINPEATYRMILPSDFNSASYKISPLFEYQFGYLYFDQAFQDCSIKHSLIMSDVF